MIAVHDRLPALFVPGADVAVGLIVVDGDEGLPPPVSGAGIGAEMIVHGGGLVAEQAVGQGVGVDRDQLDHLARQRARLNEPPIIGVDLRHDRGVDLLKRDELLVAGAIRLHEGLAVSVREEIGALEVVFESVERQFGAAVVERAQEGPERSVEAKHEEFLGGDVVDRHHDEEIAGVLIAVH